MHTYIKLYKLDGSPQKRPRAIDQDFVELLKLDLRVSYIILESGKHI